MTKDKNFSLGSKVRPSYELLHSLMYPLITFVAQKWKLT
jgi:hypothetical protein